MTITLRALTVAVTLILPACASAPTPLNDTDRHRLETQTELKLYHYEHARLRVVTRGSQHEPMAGAVYGSMGGAMGDTLADFNTLSEGRNWILSYGLEDPALAVQTRLSKAAAAAWPSLKPTSASEQLPDDAVTIARNGRHTGVALDVRTTEWSIASSYTYRAEARFIDMAEGKVLGRAVCIIREYDAEKSTTDQLKAENAALLKAKISRSVDVCADQLVAQLDLKGKPQPLPAMAPEPPAPSPTRQPVNYKKE